MDRGRTAIIAWTWLILQIDFIQDAGVVGVDRHEFGVKRLGGFGTFAQHDLVTDSGAQFVVNDQRFGCRLGRSS